MTNKMFKHSDFVTICHVGGKKNRCNLQYYYYMHICIFIVNLLFSRKTKNAADRSIINKYSLNLIIFLGGKIRARQGARNVLVFYTPIQLYSKWQPSFSWDHWRLRIQQPHIVLLLCGSTRERRTRAHKQDAERSTEVRHVNTTRFQLLAAHDARRHARRAPLLLILPRALPIRCVGTR